MENDEYTISCMNECKGCSRLYTLPSMKYITSIDYQCHCGNMMYGNRMGKFNVSFGKDDILCRHPKEYATEDIQQFFRNPERRNKMNAMEYIGNCLEECSKCKLHTCNPSNKCENATQHWCVEELLFGMKLSVLEMGLVYNDGSGFDDMMKEILLNKDKFLQRFSQCPYCTDRYVRLLNLDD